MTDVRTDFGRTSDGSTSDGRPYGRPYGRRLCDRVSKCGERALELSGFSWELFLPQEFVHFDFF